MTIPIDKNAVAAAIEQRERQLLPPSIDRARAKLSAILNGAMSVADLYATIQVLADQHAFVLEHLGDISVSEVLGSPGAPKPKPKAKDAEVGVKAINAFMGTAKEGLLKSEIMASVLKGNPSLTELDFQAAWTRYRSRLKSEGKGPTTRYSLTQ